MLKIIQHMRSHYSINWYSNKKVNVHQLWQLKITNTSGASGMLDQCWVVTLSTSLLSYVGCCSYMLTPTGLSSRNWNGTWRLTLLCSTTRWPRRCDAPTTRTVSPLSRTTSPLASSEIIWTECIKRRVQCRNSMHLWHDMVCTWCIT